MHKYELEIARPQSEHASSNAKRRPVCWIGVHDPRTPLTSIGSILTFNDFTFSHINNNYDYIMPCTNYVLSKIL